MLFDFSISMLECSFSFSCFFFIMLVWADMGTFGDALIGAGLLSGLTIAETRSVWLYSLFILGTSLLELSLTSSGVLSEDSILCIITILSPRVLVVGKLLEARLLNEWTSFSLLSFCFKLTKPESIFV